MGEIITEMPSSKPGKSYNIIRGKDGVVYCECWAWKMNKTVHECPSCKEKCEFLDNTCYTPDCQYDGTDKRIG